MKVLREYYASDNKAHNVAAGAGSGIIGLLEVCESDFSKDLAGIVSTEEIAQATSDRATKGNEIEKAAKDQDVKYKTKESASLDKAMQRQVQIARAFRRNLTLKMNNSKSWRSDA